MKSKWGHRYLRQLIFNHLLIELDPKIRIYTMINHIVLNYSYYLSLQPANMGFVLFASRDVNKLAR